MSLLAPGYLPPGYLPAPLLAGPPSPGSGLPVALDLRLGPPLVNLSQAGGVLEAGATAWVLAQVNLTDQASGSPVDAKQFPVAIAITKGDPLASNYMPATWLTRSADPMGNYARLLVGLGGDISLSPGHWRVYVQVLAGGETLVERSGVYLTVE